MSNKIANSKLTEYTLGSVAREAGINIRFDESGDVNINYISASKRSSYESNDYLSVIMNKNKFKKPEPKAITKKAVKPMKIGLVNTKSEECLTVGSPKQVNHSRRASTPTQGSPHSQHTSNSPNISHIPNFMSTSTSSTSNSSITQTKENPENLPPKKKAVPHFTAEQYIDILDVEYTKYLQAVFWKKIHESKAAKNLSELEKIEKRIVKNEDLLKKTTERLKNIQFNREIDALHDLHHPRYAEVLENLDKSNCEAYLSNLNDRLTFKRNQLKVKNMDLPGGGGGEQLAALINDSLEDFEKLKGQDSETPKVLAEIKEINQSNQREIKRGIQSIPQVENLLYERAALEICSKQPVPE